MSGRTGSPPGSDDGEGGATRTRRRKTGAEVRDADLHVLAAAVIQSGGRILLIREEDEPFAKSWVVPQGYPRPGEPLAQAAAREAREEVGLDVEIESLIGVYEEFVPAPPGPGRHVVIVGFLARPVVPAPVEVTPEAIDSAWVDPRAPPAAVRPFVRRILADVAAGLARPGRGASA